jgi:hypothetical protein
LDLSGIVKTENPSGDIVKNGFEVMCLNLQVDPVLFEFTNQIFKRFVQTLEIFLHIRDRVVQGRIVLMHIGEKITQYPIGPVHIID